VELAGQTIHLALRAIDCQAALQSGHDLQSARLIRAIWIGLERQPETRLRIHGCVTRDHTDDFVRLAVDLERLANGAAGAGEPLLPKPVADESDSRAANDVIGRGDHTPGHCPDTEDREVLG
jgi:hypothetical protein